LAASVTLPLAERMIGVMEKEKKIKQEQETRLFLMVLELQVLAKQRLIEKLSNLKFARPKESSIYVITISVISVFPHLHNFYPNVKFPSTK
jgi:hypothetical protein